MNYKFFTKISILGTELFHTAFEFELIESSEVREPSINSKENIVNEGLSEKPDSQNNIFEEEDYHINYEVPI